MFPISHRFIPGDSDCSFKTQKNKNNCTDGLYSQSCHLIVSLAPFMIIHHLCQILQGLRVIS